MHVRVVTFTGAKDIEAGVSLVRDRVLPVLKAQKGYRGLTASADRDAGVFGVLSMWDTAEDRDATESTMAPIRQEAAELIGGDVTVETFELIASEVADPPPGPGSAVMVTHFSMDPAKVDDNIAFFEREVMPKIKSGHGFQGLRHMLNRETGEGMVGTAWADDAARKEAADEAIARRAEAVARGVTFGDVSFREVVVTDLP